MPLVELELDLSSDTPPTAIQQFLDVATQRIDAFFVRRADQPVLSFVPSDFSLVYQALLYLQDSHLAAGRAFCEWGSGFGVVTHLAAMLGFDACGIEIEDELHLEAGKLADDFDVSVDLAKGTFVPSGGDHFLDHLDDISWLRLDGHDAYSQLGLEIDDFDVVFAYPWPGEEQFIDDLFEYYASSGSLLLSYHGVEQMRLQRKR